MQRKGYARGKPVSVWRTGRKGRLLLFFVVNEKFIKNFAENFKEIEAGDSLLYRNNFKEGCL